MDLGNPNLSHTQVVELVGQVERVLDVGCATGYLARALTARGCTVSGVEMDADMAAEARPSLDELVVADLDTTLLSEHFEARSFDAVVFADVLEHLRDPEKVLADAARLLRPGGGIVISLPNVTHGSMRLSMLQGHWDYRDTGILDRTHLKFFTRATFCDLVEASGFEVETLRATVADVLDVPVDVDPRRLPPGVVEWVRHQPDALSYQFVARVVPVVEGAAPAARPALQPARPADEVRAVDAWTEQAAQVARDRHAELVLRDHVIGLEAEAATARRHQKGIERRLVRARAAAAEARKRAEELRRERDDLLASRTWRAGRLVSAPLRSLRGRGRA